MAYSGVRGSAIGRWSRARGRAEATRPCVLNNTWWRWQSLRQLRASDPVDLLTSAAVLEVGER